MDIISILDMTEAYIQGASKARLFAFYGHELDLDDAAQTIVKIVLDNNQPASVRYRAAKTLGVIGGEHAFSALYDLYLTDSDFYLRELCAASLIQLNNRRALSTLLPHFRNASEAGKTILNRAFEGLVDERVLPDLIQLATDEDVSVRILAVRHLRKFKHRRAVQALIKATSDSEWKVRSMALSILGEYGDIDPDIVGVLIQPLNESNVEARRSAVYSLGKLGDLQAVEPLLELLRQGNLEPEIVEALTHILNPTTVRRLQHFKKRDN